MNALDQIKEMFDSAETSLKTPSIRLRTPSGVKLHVCPDRTYLDENRSKLQIRKAGRIVGLVDFETRKFIPRKDLPQEARQTVLDFLTDPIRSAQKYAELTGDCCFCGRYLTDPRSVTVGYGPVCADRFGLPWGHHNSIPDDLSDLFLSHS